MKPIALAPADLRANPALLDDTVLTREMRVDGVRFRKGQRLTAADADGLADAEIDLHLVRLEPDDVHEDAAAVALAGMVAGDGSRARRPVQSRVNIEAIRKGMVRIDRAALDAINGIPELSVFTVLDHLPVVPGKVIAGAKIAGVAVDQSVLDHARASLSGPVVRVAPFLPLRVGVIVTQALANAARERFEASVRAKIAWYGAEIVRFTYVDDVPGDIAREVRSLLDDDADMILMAGGHMLDPLDATLTALPEVGAHLVRLGAPAHPGSMFWLAHHDATDTPIVNLASCSMYSRSTVADLVLPRLMTGERVSDADLAGFGFGGLLDRDMGFRFPPYEHEAADEPDERE